jgi:hypothetical protein
MRACPASYAQNLPICLDGKVYYLIEIILIRLVLVWEGIGAFVVLQQVGILQSYDIGGAIAYEVMRGMEI